MTNKELKRKYEETVKRVEKAKMFDGRDKGVDVYVCKKCGAVKYTRYKDKGVTPFTLLCENDGCLDIMIHENTISEWEAMMSKVTVHNWVRPTFEWLDKQRTKGRDRIIEHVLDGGLILESELQKNNFK